MTHFSDQNLFTKFHSYTRMASLIRTRQGGLYVTRSRHFRRGNLWVQLYPRMKIFQLMPRWASNHRRTTSWASTLLSAPQSIQLNHQRGFSFDICLISWFQTQEKLYSNAPQNSLFCLVSLGNDIQIQIYSKRRTPA